MSDSFMTIPELAGSAAFCVLILDKTFSFVGKVVNKHNGGNGGMSGEKSTDYWKAEYRSGVREVMREQGWGETLREIANGVNKLVAFEEIRQREGR
jgi:hypothetical protein